MFPTTDRHACQNSHTRTILVIDINPETDTQLHTDMHETHSNQSHTETKTYNHKPQTDTNTGTLSYTKAHSQIQTQRPTITH